MLRRLPRPDRLVPLIAAIALLGATHALARQIGYGVGLYADSINYIAVARNLLAGEGFANYGGDPYILFPPLYPLLLAAGLGALDPAQIAAALNAPLFGITVFAVGIYLLRRLASRPLAIWATLTLALAIPLADIASFAMSEPAFILATTLALISAGRCLRRGDASALLWTAAICALAWQARYMGAAAVGVIGLGLLLQRGITIPRRIARAAIFALITGLPMAAWLLRNILTTGNLIGGGLPVEYSLPEALTDIRGGIAAWSYFDLPLLPSDELVLQATTAVVIASTTALLAARLLASRMKRTSPTDERPPSDWLAAWLFGGFALAYCAALLASVALGRAWHGIEPRYLLPLYVPLLVVLAVALDNALAAAHPTRVRWQRPQAALALALSAALTVWLAAQIAPAVRDVARANAGGIERGLASKAWADSAALRYIRENPLTGETYSNYPIMLYYHNPVDAIYRALPASIPTGRIRDAKPDGNDSTGREQLAAWIADAGEGDYVVWFDIGNNRRYDYAAPALRAANGLEPVADLSDGVIFRVNRAYAAPANPHLSAYRRIRAGDYGKPAAQSQYDLYLRSDALTYLKEPCSATDADARFFLHIIPADAADLLPDRRAYGFANLDFAFPRYGVNLDGKCVIIADLPPYDIAGVRTGQFVSGEAAQWRVEIDLSAPAE